MDPRKKLTGNRNEKQMVAKNGTPYIQSICAEVNHKKTRFISSARRLGGGAAWYSYLLGPRNMFSGLENSPVAQNIGNMFAGLKGKGSGRRL